MAISAINHQSASSVGLQPDQAAAPAKNKFFQTPIHLTLVLRFFSTRELADVAKTSLVFRSSSITAVEHVIRSKKTLPFSELCDFAKYQSHCQDVGNLMHVSPYLTNLTELDFSNWNFANESFLYLRNLSYERLSAITSLNFTDVQKLSFKKLNSLLVRLSPFNNKGTEKQINSQALFPNLNSLNFTRSNYAPETEELFNVCPWLKNGQGKWTFTSGYRHEGQWLEGKPSEPAAFIHPDEEQYEGERLGANYHGRGILTYPNGAKYEGNWLRGMRHGLGILTYSDGSQYQGEWLEGVEHGQGRLTHLAGAKYEGNWLEGMRHGQGAWYHPNGEKYEGGWVKGKASGYGVMVFSNGTSCEGEWLEGVFQGESNLLLE